MTGTLAQLVTLVSFGNDFLANGKLPEDFYTKNASFQFCNKVDFRIFRKPLFFKEKEVVVANNPGDWLRYLKNDGCRKLRLFFQSSKDQSRAKDYKLAGLVGGGGTWLIEAIYPEYSNGWANRWEVTKKDDPENKIWSVSYGMTAKKFSTINLQIEPEWCKDELNEALVEIEKFAFQQKLDNWGNQFKKARETLFSDHPETNYYNKELLPTVNYSLCSRQILFAAGTAWVFGAMGSWNDLGFGAESENDQYETLTEILYAKVNDAIISTVNSF